MDGLRPFQGRQALTDAGVVAVLAATAIFVTAVLVQRPCLVGSYLDDTVYLTTAKALAEGRGYRHLELPGEPYQTKYPILYPALLSLVWRARPEFPAIMSVVQILNVVLWGSGSWLAYRLLRRAWQLPWWLAACAAVLAFTSTLTLTVLQTAMSEPLYFVLSMAALVLADADGARPGRATTRPDLRPRLAIAGVRAPLLGLLGGAAFLTRSLGMAVMVSALATAVLRRRWRLAAVSGVLFAIAVGGWHVWCAYAAAINAANPVTAALRYDLDYSLWMGPGLGTHLWIAWQNTSELLFWLLLTLVQLSPSPAVEALESGPGRASWVYLGMAAVAALVLLGLVLTWRRSRPTVHLYIACYLAMVLVWPFSPHRFLVVLLPLLLALLLAAVYGLATWVFGHVAGRGRLEQVPPGTQTWLTELLERRSAAAALPVTIALAGLLAYLEIRPLVGTGPAAEALRTWLQTTHQQREDLVTVIRQCTPPEAVISSHLGGYLHLRTGRKFVPPLPGEGQIQIYYAPDRSFLSCGQVASPGMIQADLEYTGARLVDFLRTTAAGYVVPLVGRPAYETVFEQLRQARPDYFRLVRRAEPHALYRVQLPPG